MTALAMLRVPEEEVPIAGEYDVVVCGGGPAGIAAAVAAARDGARTVLIEQLASLGGMATAARVCSWCDTQNGPLADEFERRLTELGLAKRSYNPDAHLCKVGRMRFDSATAALIALEMVRESGSDVLLCTFAESAWVEDGRVRGVFIANKGGRSLLKAAVVIDATADGDIAAGAGAEYMKGDPEDGRLQHVNFGFQLAGVDHERYRENEPDSKQILAWIRVAQSEGRLRAPAGVFRPKPDDFPYDASAGRFFFGYWEVEKVDPSDPVAVSKCLVECQTAALDVLRFCREHLPGYEKCRIGWLPGLLGTRESRRIVGEYILTHDDLVAGRKFDDGIAQACFFADLHDSPPGVTIPFPWEFKIANMPPPDDYYEIPYRCLVPKAVDGILVAGRCISCDRPVQGSMRIQPTCMFVAEAAGMAAAVCAEEGIQPRAVDARRIRARIMP